MKLTILGSGSAIIREDRAGPSFLIETGEKKLLLDCGWGTPLRLAQAKINEQDLDHIFITHRHADHMSTLEAILQSMHVRGVYPPGIKRTKSLFLHGYPGFKKDLEILRQLHIPDVVEEYPVEVLEYDGNSHQIDGIKIDSLSVEHVKFFPSAAFKISDGKKSIFYSGDLGYSEKIGQFAQGCDLLLLEMCIPSDLAPRPNHLSPLECGKIAAESGTKKLVLWHLYDNIPESEALLDIQKNFSGEVIFSHDHQKISI